MEQEETRRRRVGGDGVAELVDRSLGWFSGLLGSMGQCVKSLRWRPGLILVMLGLESGLGASVLFLTSRRGSWGGWQGPKGCGGAGPRRRRGACAAERRVGDYWGLRGGCGGEIGSQGVGHRLKRGAGI